MNSFEFISGRFTLFAWFDWLDQAIEIEFIPTLSLNYSPCEFNLIVAWLTFGFQLTFRSPSASRGD